jgi:hypothetical protein
MPDPLPQVAALALVLLVALFLVGAQLLSIARDADWWVITRGVVGERYARLMRTLRRKRI